MRHKHNNIVFIFTTNGANNVERAIYDNFFCAVIYKPFFNELYTLLFFEILALLVLSNLIEAISAEKNDPHSKYNRRKAGK